MQVSIASDHRGVQLKNKIVDLLNHWGHTVCDEGPEVTESVDYPDFAARVSAKVANGEVDRGIINSRRVSNSTIEGDTSGRCCVPRSLPDNDLS